MITPADETKLIEMVYTTLDFENITNSVLSGTAIESDLTAPIEALLGVIPLSTPALKAFAVRIAPIDVAVGVGSTRLSESGAPLPLRSEWTIHVGAVDLDLQNSRIVESGTLAVGAVRSDDGDSASVLTPAGHALLEMSAAGSARFPLEFKNHQLWFDFLLGKDHVTTAHFTTTTSSPNAPGGQHARHARGYGHAGDAPAAPPAVHAAAPFRTVSRDADADYPGAYDDDNDDNYGPNWFTECNVTEVGAPETSCFVVNVDNSSVIEMCATSGGCELSVAGEIAFESLPMQYVGNVTLNYADISAIQFEATAFNGDGPRNAGVVGVVGYNHRVAYLYDIGDVVVKGNVSMDGGEFLFETGADWNMEWKKSQNSSDDDYGPLAWSTFDVGANFTLVDHAFGCQHPRGDTSCINGTVVKFDAQPRVNFDDRKFIMPLLVHWRDDNYEGDVELQCGGPRLRGAASTTQWHNGTDDDDDDYGPKSSQICSKS